MDRNTLEYIVWIIELLKNRFLEFGIAVWEKVIEKLAVCKRRV